MCHHHRLGVPLGGNAAVGEQVGGKREVLLEGELGLGLTEKGKGRHFLQLMRAVVVARAGVGSVWRGDSSFGSVRR